MPKFKVQSKPERFRRAGIEFTREGVELDSEKLTKEQIEAINAEPNLTIVGEDAPVPAASKKAAR